MSEVAPVIVKPNQRFPMTCQCVDEVNHGSPRTFNFFTAHSLLLIHGDHTHTSSTFFVLRELFSPSSLFLIYAPMLMKYKGEEGNRTNIESKLNLIAVRLNQGKTVVGHGQLEFFHSLTHKEMSMASPRRTES